MSIQAVSWALKLPVPHSPAKFVLVAMANYAGADMRVWPSVSMLVKDTCQDRKTVLANIKRLADFGYIVDTNERIGQTKSIVVYRLSEPQSGTDIGTTETRQNQPEAVPEMGHLNSTEIGTPSENEAVPIFPLSSPNFPLKQSQFSPEAVPVFPTEPSEPSIGTIREPLYSANACANPADTTAVAVAGKPEKKTSPRGARLPADWMLPKDLGDWALAERDDLTTDDVRKLAEEFRDHWISASGAKASRLDWPATWRNWVRNDLKFNGRRRSGMPRSGQPSQADLDRINAEAYALTFGKPQGEIIDV